MTVKTDGIKGRVMRWALRQPRIHPWLSHTAAHALIVIADRFNIGEGYAWPTWRDISERSNIPERSVRRAIDELELRAIIIKGARLGEDGRKLSNAYTLAFDNEIETELESAWHGNRKLGFGAIWPWQDVANEAAARMYQLLRELPERDRERLGDRLGELRNPHYLDSLERQPIRLSA